MFVPAARCCREGTGPDPVWQRVGENYYLALDRIERETRAAAIDVGFSASAQHGHCFEGPIKGCIVPEVYGFWLSIVPMADATIDWSAVRYVDEHGRDHPTYHYPVGEAPVGGAQPLSDADVPFEVIGPASKRYPIYKGCKRELMFEEPLLPYSLEGRSVDQADAQLDQLERARATVHLAVPVKTGNVRETYRFMFRIAKR